jgi:hypothetical protein
VSSCCLPPHGHVHAGYCDSTARRLPVKAALRGAAAPRSRSVPRSVAPALTRPCRSCGLPGHEPSGARYVSHASQASHTADHYARECAHVDRLLNFAQETKPATACPGSEAVSALHYVYRFMQSCSRICSPADYQEMERSIRQLYRQLDQSRYAGGQQSVRRRRVWRWACLVTAAAPAIGRSLPRYLRLRCRVS